LNLLCTLTWALNAVRFGYRLRWHCGGSRCRSCHFQDPTYFFLLPHWRCVRHKQKPGSFGRVQPVGDSGRDSCKIHILLLKQGKVFETNHRPALQPFVVMYSGTDANPVQFASYALRDCVAANSTNSNHRIKLISSHSSHAILYAEPAVFARIALVSSFEDQYSHISTSDRKTSIT
jgi:hypothetical protein